MPNRPHPREVKPLHPRTLELLAILDRPPSRSEKLRGRAAEETAILGELAGRAELALVPHLLDFIFGGERQVARAAARVAAVALRAAPRAELPSLEEACRRPWGRTGAGRQHWVSLSPVAVSRFSDFGDDEPAVIGLASYHASGWVREAAVTRLDTLDDSLALGFLLIRLNDWVDPVANRARLAMERRVDEQHADQFLENLPITFRLAIARRRDHQALLDSVFRLIQSARDGDVLRRGLASPDRAVRRVLFRLARQAPGARHEQLLRLALDDPDTVVRLESLGQLRERIPSGDLPAWIPGILRDPYPAVRREALTIAGHRLGSEADQWIRDSAMDPNRVVREVARFLLRRRNLVGDFAALYRERIHNCRSRRELATALAGLGETGTPDDASIIEPFLGHDEPVIRRAAIGAYLDLDLEEHIPMLVRMLDDPAPSVTGTLRRRLPPHADKIGLSRLRRALREAPFPHGRFDALVLGRALGKWDSVPLLLEAAADGDARIRESAERWLEEWVAKQNRSFAPPSKDQLLAIRRALDEFGRERVRWVHSELRAVLKFWDG